MLGFKAFYTAHGTLVGSVLMHMLETLPIVVEEGGGRVPDYGRTVLSPHCLLTPPITSTSLNLAPHQR